MRRWIAALAFVAVVACDGPTIPGRTDNPVPTPPQQPTPPGSPSPLPPVPDPPKGRTARSGVVSGAGREFVDGQGTFSPYGATLFWAVRGWKFERERVQANIDWLAAQGFDYIRVLGQVDWVGNEIDPAWPDYEEQLAGLIDYTYAAGMRVQLTLMGSPYRDPMGLARRIAPVVAARPHKVIFLEVANEWWQNFSGGVGDLRSIGSYLRGATPNLVALSAPAGEATEETKGWVGAGAASMGVAHFDRADNTVEWKWRHVRKPWESRGPSFPASSNEPGGPRSSVAQYEEAIHLVMLRAVGILAGYTGFVLHNGAGVQGVVNSCCGGRPANVWEVPDIEATARAIRELDKILPANPSMGTPTRAGVGGTGGHPLGADAFVVDAGRGVVRDYASVRGDGTFWQVLFGLKDYVVLTSDAAYDLEFVDPLTGIVEHRRSVAARESIRIEPGAARDSRGWGAYIVRGRRR